MESNPIAANADTPVRRKSCSRQSVTSDALSSAAFALVKPETCVSSDAVQEVEKFVLVERAHRDG